MPYSPPVIEPAETELLAILTVTLPIFALIGIGYLCVRLGLVDRAALAAFGWFVMHLALPAVLIKSLAERPFERIANAPFFLAYAAATLSVLLLALFVHRRLRRRGLTASAIMALGTAQPNSGFIGFPIVYQLLGEPAVVAFALVLIVENLFTIPTALALAEAGTTRAAGGPGLAARLARNPLLIAILIGMALSLSGWSLPSPVVRGLDMLGSAAAPVALFVIGGHLVGVQPRGMAGDVIYIVLGKLLVHPLAVALVLLALPALTPVTVQAGILFAASPMLSIYAVIGQRYGQERMCSLALLVATLASFLSLSAAIGLLGVVVPR